MAACPATFAEAKAIKTRLADTVIATSKALGAFPGEGPMNLVPDHIKFSQPYRTAKRAFDNAFDELRAFNAIYTKRFSKELRDERAARRSNRS